MFGHLLKARLKTAERALRGGRLDEAFRLASSPDLRAHRRGVAILSSLTDRFTERARDHYRADRFAEALMDLDRAEACGGTREEIAELRAQVVVVAAEERRQAQSRKDRVDAAKQRVERGSLAAGRRLLDRASRKDPAASQLRREIVNRAEETAGLIAQAETLIANGQLAAAAERVRRAKTIDAQNRGVGLIETRICNHVLDTARRAIVEGRLSRAADELACLGPLGDSLPSKRELTELLATASEATNAVAEGRYADARRHALTLARLLPDATWVSKAMEDLQRVDEIRTSLRAGPFGERLGDNRPAAARNKRTPPERGSLDDTVELPRRAGAGGLPDRLLLLVEGGGSYLLLMGGQASIGRAASNKPADVPVFSDIAERHANIARVDEDYFFFSSKVAEVAGRRAKHQLLRDGDRIVLGAKARFTFRVPSRKSATATIELSDTTKMPQDVRRVVLFDRHATIGQGPTAHIACRHLQPALVLFERSGSLWIRQRNDGHVNVEATELKLSEATEIGGVGLVLEPWRLRSPGIASG